MTAGVTHVDMISPAALPYQQESHREWYKEEVVSQKLGTISAAV